MSDGVRPLGQQDWEEVGRSTPSPPRGDTESLVLPPEELFTSSRVKWGGAGGGLLRSLGAGKLIKGVQSSNLVPSFQKAGPCKESAP